ncbi:hypothetical protein JCM6882_003646 [Rhodosporidiobolus microsporus]
MSGRAKSTRKAATSASYVDPPEFDEIAGSSDEGEESDEEGEETKGRKRSGKGRGNKGSSSTAKKRKTDKGKGKGKKGAKVKVDHLRTLPMDLLVEIFSYLLPFELLQLSRTSKEYRTLLCSKRSKSIWRSARRLVELPNLEADDLSEMAFAQLIFGNTCDACDVRCTRTPDFALRTRLCKDCRKDSFVKLNKRFSKDYPQYHPSTLEAVITTSYSAAQERYATSSSSYALKSDLDYYSKKLHELQEDDDGDAELFNRNSSKSASSTRSGRNSRFSVANDAEDEDDEPESRVEQFIEGRKAAVEVVKKDAEKLSKSYERAGSAAKTNQREWWCIRDKLKHPNYYSSQSRSEALREKVIATDGYTWTDTYDSKLWDNSPLVARAVPLTDQEWDAIKPQILELAQQIRQVRKKNREKRDATQAWQALAAKREQNVGQRLKSLRHNEADGFARAAFPLQADLVLFESVKPLLLPAKTGDVADYGPEIDDDEWDAALPAIKEEIEAHRVDVFLHAIKLILSVTTDGDLPDDDEILDNLDEYDDDFLARATSLLVCDLPDCRRKAFSRGILSAGRNRWGGHTRFERVPLRPVFISSFLSLLEHQHKEHASFDSKSKKEKRLGPRFHTALPMEVACAVSALIEVGELDGETVGVEELDELDAGGWGYGWENSHKGKKRYETWRELLDAVFSESQRYARMSPPKSLDPPCIVYRAIA